MHTYYRITVEPSYRWNNVRVAGRDFSKSSVSTLNEAEVTDEILGSPLLVVEVAEPDKPKAKPRSRQKAKAKEEGND